MACVLTVHCGGCGTCTKRQVRHGHLRWNMWHKPLKAGATRALKSGVARAPEGRCAMHTLKQVWHVRLREGVARAPDGICCTSP